MASASYRTRDAANVGEPLLVGCQKMKYGSVMPNIVGTGLQFGGEDVGHTPMNVVGSFSHALFRDVDRSLGNIEYGDVLVSARDKIVGQRGFAAAYINDGRRKTSTVLDISETADVSRCGWYQLTVSGALVL